MEARKSIAALNRATLTVLVLSLLVAPSASLAARQPPRPTQDSVSGSGLVPSCGGDNRFTIDARSGPNGESPAGDVRCGNSSISGPVTCLEVRGNVALLIVQSSTIFGDIAVRITDDEAGDRLEASPTSFATGGGCPSPLSSYFDFPFSGDLVVVDASPAPSSKDQCKNDGYAGFGFKNQGQCVAFVQRGPKP